MRHIVEATGRDRNDLPDAMRPDSPALYNDASYVFYAMDLLARREPTIALRLLKAALIKHG